MENITSAFRCRDLSLTGNDIEYATVYLINSCLSSSPTSSSILNHCETNSQAINKIKMTKTFPSSFHNLKYLEHHKSSIHRVRCLSVCEMSNHTFHLRLVADSISLLHNITSLLSIPSFSCHHVLMCKSPQCCIPFSKLPCTDLRSRSVSICIQAPEPSCVACSYIWILHVQF